MSNIHTTMRDTVLAGLRLNQTVLVDGREHSRSTVVGWSAGAPWVGDTIQIRIDHFDDVGRVIDREFIDVTRDQIHED